jgi:hypothetical protein
MLFENGLDFLYLFLRLPKGGELKIRAKEWGLGED